MFEMNEGSVNVTPRKGYNKLDLKNGREEVVIYERVDG